MKLLKKDNSISELLPREDVIGLVSYEIDIDDKINIVGSHILNYMDENGFDSIKIHFFYFNPKPNKSFWDVFKMFKNKLPQMNITFHDNSLDERPGTVYLNRGDEEEKQNIKYVSNGSYYITGDELLQRLDPLIQKAKYNYKKINILQKMFNYLKQNNPI